MTVVAMPPTLYAHATTLRLIYGSSKLR